MGCGRVVFATMQGLRGGGVPLWTGAGDIGPFPFQESVLVQHVRERVLADTMATDSPLHTLGAPLGPVRYPGGGSPLPVPRSNELHFPHSLKRPPP